MPLSCDGRKLAVALLLSFSFAGAAPRSAGVSPVHQAPPLVVEPAQIDQMFSTLSEVLRGQ